MSTPRQEQILREAARMFAEYGYHGVSTEDLGAAVGISGPAVYRHFASKDALLADLLVGISEELLQNGRVEVAGAKNPTEALQRLVRRLQRSYVELWVDQLVPPLDRDEARARAHAVFGLMNSTPHLPDAAN